MRVTAGHNPHAYRQQPGKTKGKGFAEMYADRASKNEKQHGHRGPQDRDREIIQTEYGNTGRIDPHDIRHIRGRQFIPSFGRGDWANYKRQPNEYSKGNRELTDKQIQGLRASYDLNNMSPQDQYCLLCDLTDMGVLSAADLTASDQSKVDAVLKQIETYNPQFGEVHHSVQPEQPELLSREIPGPTYPDSIHDLSPEALKAATKAAADACSFINKKGLTSGELYNKIESIFKDYLGEDFQDPSTIMFSTMGIYESGEHTDSLKEVSLSFHRQLRTLGVISDESPLDVTLREARGYSNMTDDEIRAAVREKYPDSMTYKDVILMNRELCDLGLEDTNYAFAMKLQFNVLTGMRDDDPQAQKLFAAILDTPSDFDVMKATYNKFVASDRQVSPSNDMETLFNELLSWIGGNEASSKGLRAIRLSKRHIM